MLRKAVILARGMGKRMRRDAGDLTLDPLRSKFVERGWKPFIPIAGRPFIDHQLRMLSELGIEEVCLVVGPEHLELKEHFEKVELEFEIKIEFAIQEKPLGTADAVYASRNFVGKDPFLLLNGDNFYPREALESLIGREDPERCYVAGFRMDSMIKAGNFSPERIRSFSVMEVDDELNLLRIVEKPEKPEAYKTKHDILVNMNLWRFNPVIFKACKLVKPHPVRGEFELTSAVQLMVDERMCEVRVIPLSSYVLDLTYSSDIPVVEQILEKFMREKAQAGRDAKEA